MKRTMAPVGVGIIFVCIGAALTDYGTYLVGRVAVFVLLTIGLNLLIGVSGLLSLASAAFMGLGAYTTTILMTTLGLPVWVAIPAAVVSGWVIGWLLGLVSLRLSHFYLALISLGFLLTFQVILLRGGGTTGAGYGLVAANGTLFGHTISPNEWAYTALFLAGVCLVLAQQLVNSRIGRAWRAMKHNETMAELCGVNLLKNKTASFALSSALAALAGCVYAFLQGAISPAAFNISATVDQLAYVIVGGLASVWGALLGPLVLLMVPEYLRSLGDKRELVFGVVLLVVLVAAPQGLAGAVKGLIHLSARSLSRLGVPRLTDFAASHPASSSALGEPTPSTPVPIPPRGAPVVPAVPPVRHSIEVRVALAVRDLSVHYGGVRAVEHATFDVREGSLHGLIGPNGAGKTTLLNALTGLVTVAGGDVRLGEVTLRSGRGGVRRRDLITYGVSRTFQTPLVVPDLSAIDNVMLGLHASTSVGLVGASIRSRHAVRESRESRELSVEALQLIGMQGDIEAPASNLGFGDLRRIELARCVVARPRLLVLDEPTSGLELDEARNVVSSLKAIQSSGEGTPLTILMVEHNVPLVFGMCDRVTAMHEGRILITDDAEAVRADEQVRESYLVTSTAPTESDAAIAQELTGGGGQDHD